MANCNDCNRRIKGKRRDHICDAAVLDNGHRVHVSRIDDKDGDVRKEIENGNVKVVGRFRQKIEKLFEKDGEKKTKSGLIVPGR